MNEAQFKQKLIKKLDTRIFVHVTSDAIQVGVPDLYLLFHGQSAWIELKVIDWDNTFNKRQGTKVLSHELKPKQIEFMIDVIKHGASAACIIGFSRDNKTYVKIMEGFTRNITKEEFDNLPELSLDDLNKHIVSKLTTLAFNVHVWSQL